MGYQDKGRSARTAAERERDPQHGEDFRTNPDPQPSAALAQVTGSFSDARVANERLAFANANFHLVSPSSNCGTLQVGCELALSAVMIDIKEETYDVGLGKRALHKAPLEKIAAAIGLSWIRNGCHRLDDGSDPHYAHFCVAGAYKSFDGQMLVVTGEKEMDLREGSVRVLEINRRADLYNKKNRRREDFKQRYPDDQIRMERMNILSHAETKAKLRAIRSLGLRAAYKPEALAKPFVCARVMFTGRTDDPELAKLFAGAIASSYLNSQVVGYGSQLPALPAAAPSGNDNRDREPPVTVNAEVIERHAPPKVGERVSPTEREDDELDPDDDGDDYGSGPRSDPPPPPAAAARRARPRQQPEHLMPAGPERDMPLSKASNAQLQFWSNRLRDDLDAGNSRDPEADEDLFEAMLDELKVKDR
jgi:hypothetical protein